VEPELRVYLKRGKLTVWKKLPRGLWFKWLPNTPKAYADIEARVLNRKPDYGPCFWGAQDEAPEETGYQYVGKLLTD